MKKAGRPVFFIVLAIIALFTLSVTFGVTTFYGDVETVWIKGVDQIRWGIDIRGGVDVTFTPPEDFDADDTQLDAAKEVVSQRLITLGIVDSEIYVDYGNDKVIVRFPWKEGESDFDPESAVRELGETALLTFREGMEVDEAGLPTGTTAETIILQGADISKATPQYYTNEQGQNEWSVGLELSDTAAEKFSEATARLAPTQGVISIWMDETMISSPQVNEHITGNKASISGSAESPFTAESAKELADKINGGALPFKMVTSSFSTISPTLGLGARDAMIISGAIAFIIIAIMMIALYRLPGVMAVIALVGHVAGMLAAITGYLGFLPSSTLTVPGIAGIILSIGMGVDANVITFERIKEELAAGKTLDGAIASGYKRAFSAILDGNITVVIVAVILMGAFGPPDSTFAKMLNWAFFLFGPSTAGSVYSFGFTLLVGVVLNLITGLLASRLMLSSISKFKAFRNPALYGGVKKHG